MFLWIQAEETEETAAENGGNGGNGAGNSSSEAFRGIAFKRASILIEFDDGDQRRDEGRAGIH